MRLRKEVQCLKKDLESLQSHLIIMGQDINHKIERLEDNFHFMMKINNLKKEIKDIKSHYEERNSDV
jgi:uncharacterized protein YoxC